MTPREAAELLGRDHRTISYLAKRGLLESVKVAGFRYILRSSLEAEIERRRAASARPAPAPKAKQAPSPAPVIEAAKPAGAPRKRRAPRRRTESAPKKPAGQHVDEAWLDGHIGLAEAAKSAHRDSQSLFAALRAEGIELVVFAGKNWVRRQDWSDWLGRHPVETTKRCSQSRWRPECRGCIYKGVEGTEEVCEKFPLPLLSPSAADGDCIWLGVRRGDPPREAALPEMGCSCGAEVRDGRCTQCGRRQG